MTAQTITGWKWDTIEEFNADKALCDAHYNLPNDGATSSMSANISYTPEVETDFYYVGYNKELAVILGDTQQFMIRIL